MIRIGELNGGLTTRLEEITRLWTAAGFNAKHFEDINQLIWEKYICNITFSAPCTVFDCMLGKLFGSPDLWKIAPGCMTEVYQLGIASGVAFSFNDPVQYVTEFGMRMPEAYPSMLQDHRACRASEIDAINGTAVELGAKLNVATPYNETLTAVVRQR